MRHAVPLLLSLTLAVLTLTADGAASRASEPERILIFAAASTREVVRDAAARFQTSTGAEVRVSAVHAASSALARQILDGAPADLFLSANRVWMDRLREAGMVAQEAVAARNRLVLIAPVATPGTSPDPTPEIRSAEAILPALGVDGRLSVAETTAVPAGLYAMEALRYFGVSEALRPRLAEAGNVRAALRLVERGEAPLGLVYQSDAQASRAVQVLWQIPAPAHRPILYPLALLENGADKGGADKPGAQAFFAFLQGPEGRAILKRHGFLVDGLPGAQPRGDD